MVFTLDMNPNHTQLEPDVYIDLDLTAKRLETNFDALLVSLSDKALVQALDGVQGYEFVTTHTAKQLMSAGLTALFVARIHRERDRRLRGTHAAS